MSDFHVAYGPNPTGRDFVVGDLHGHYDLLLSELGMHGFDPHKGDRCFSVGDLIDRGPESAKTLLLAQEPWFIPVRGNHEQMMLDSTSRGDMDLWFVNGGTWFADSPREHWKEYVETAVAMPLAITLHHASDAIIGICHAEPPTLDWDDIEGVEHQPAALENMIWGRDRIQSQNAAPVRNVDFIFCGHTALRNGIATLGNVVYIDTGAYFTDTLTVLSLDDFLHKHFNDGGLLI